MSKLTKHTALLITFYWPPSGGPGVHRWLRFSRFFKQNNWDLHVYCPEDAAWPMIDPALEAAVSPELTIVRRRIFEPHKMLGKKNNPNVGGGFTKQKESSRLQQFIIWVRGNLFIPDARVFWIQPSARFLTQYLKQHPEIDTIISTGPPHSMHRIAYRLKKTFPQLKWVADFRDPWTEIDFYEDLSIGKRADDAHKRMEKEVLQGADLVISIGENCAAGLARIGGRPVEIFTNGFIFPEFDPQKVDLPDQFIVAHFGSMSFPRNPLALWKALQRLVAAHPSFAQKLEVQLVGPVDFGVFESIEAHGLTPYVKHIPHVPHQTSIDMQQQTPVLLLVANKTGNVKGILTGKFFEYLGAKRPILAIGEAASDLEKIIHQTQSGAFFDYADDRALEQRVLEWFTQFEAKQLISQATDTASFSSETIVHQLLTRFDQLHSNTSR
jgi:hypothetical protein